MKFILGVFVGAALMLGSAYLHDTGVVRAGPAQPFVNWDTVIGMLGRCTAGRSASLTGLISGADRRLALSEAGQAPKRRRRRD